MGNGKPKGCVLSVPVNSDSDVPNTFKQIELKALGFKFFDMQVQSQ